MPEEKRGRGRPKGSSTKPSESKILGAMGADASNATLTPSEQQTRRRKELARTQTILDKIADPAHLDGPVVIVKPATSSARKKPSIFEAAEMALQHGHESYNALNDAFEAIRLVNTRDTKRAHLLNQSVRSIAADQAVKRLSPDYYNLYQRALLFDAPIDFDAFMQYIEFDRPNEERFWLPRREKLLHIAKACQKLEDGELDELFLAQAPRTGKSLANNTKVLTSDGWKNHGDLKVGDKVLGMDGSYKKVIAVMPKCQLDVMVEFTNGEKIQCHENHEWKLFDRNKKKYVTLETKEYEKEQLESGTPGRRGHRYRFQLPHKAYIQGEDKELPLDPYTLGVWLGDGTNQKPLICNAEPDKAIINRIEKRGIPVRNEYQHNKTGVWYYSFDIRKELKTMDMCFSRKRKPKRIPDEYLTASVKQRLNLLAGLIDTDGTYNRKTNRYSFTTCEETLRDSFVELISTFGWRACVTEYSPTVSSSGIVGKHTAYAIGFSPDCEIPCTLERKRNKKARSMQRAIAVKSITRVKPEEGNSIMVEGDGMYLAGRTMLPTHNTTLMSFFLLHNMGRNSELSNLYCSYTDSVVGTFYSGLLEVLQDKATYKFYDVFPNSNIASTNAKDNLLNLDRKKRYASFTGRSLYGTLNGACDCNGFLIADDLLSGIEEAMSKDRLATAWSHADNNMLPRAKENCKILWIGTRWSLLDPAGRRMDLLQNDPTYKDRRWLVVNTPALNRRDESNFDYQYGVGFSTDYYRQRRASFERNNDMASWMAQYQGEPIERDGAVFTPEGMRYYNGDLPDGTPDRVFAVVDPAYGGGDFVSAPFMCQYGSDIYVTDVVFNNGEKNITQPLITKKAKELNISALKVEGTRSTSGYGEDLDRQMKANGMHVNTVINTSHFTGTGKRQRIFDKAPDIREHMIFLADGYRSKEYQQFMTNLFSFTVTGKAAKHDDAPDSLAMAIEFAYAGQIRPVSVVDSPFH